MPGCENVGNWITGTIPNRLFTRMNANSVVRNGTYLMNSGPMLSLAIEFRTIPWKDSPRNCDLLGTSAGFRTL